MAISTYAELQSAVTSWILRDNIPAERVKDFIRLAESKMNLRLRCRENSYKLEQNIGTVTAVTIPANYLEMIRIRPTATWVDDGSGPVLTYSENYGPLTLHSPDALSVPSVSGVPYAYAHYPDGDYWKIYPVGQYQITVWYYGKVTALTDSVTTSELLTNWPDLYLSGALLEAEMYLKTPPDKMGPWGGMFTSMIEQLTKLHRVSQSSGSQMLTRNPYGNR